MPAGWEAADLLAASPEWLLTAGDRRHAGSVYTPPGIAAGVLGQAVARWTVSETPLVCDPACGGGAFLLAAARWLHGLGHPPERVLDDLLWGCDVDPLAVRAARSALASWASSTSSAGPGPARREREGRVIVGNSLTSGPQAWPAGAPGFDLVVGNPPFQGQLGRGTARSRRQAAELTTALGGVAGGYADTAAVFLVAARRLVVPGGRVALVLPESVLAARDAAPARAAALLDADLVGLWVAGEPVFDAATKVCAPVLQVRDGSAAAPAEPVRAMPCGPRRGTGLTGAGPGDRSALHPAVVEPIRTRAPSGDPEPGLVHLTRGPGFEDMAAVAPPDRSSTWSALALTAYGTPEVDLPAGSGTVGDLANATAGFRRQFYGLVPYVSEARPDGPAAIPLITAGLIDPARCLWGRRPARFAGDRYDRPSIDRAALSRGDPPLAQWVAARRVPKVLVATQTRVVEAVADHQGRWVPSVPVISVEPHDPADVERLAAVLLSPTTSAWALAHAGGTALAPGMIKLSAAQIARIPLPADVEAWTEATSLVARAEPDWRHFGPAMLAAYRMEPDHPVLIWWLARLPDARR